MNKDIFEGKWNQFKGKIKEKWGRLTNNELTQINGKRDQLLGKLQTKEGWSKDQVSKEVDEVNKTGQQQTSEDKQN